jgi:hypothetical protein
MLFCETNHCLSKVIKCNAYIIKQLLNSVVISQIILIYLNLGLAHSWPYVKAADCIIFTLQSKTYAHILKAHSYSYWPIKLGCTW